MHDQIAPDATANMGGKFHFNDSDRQGPARYHLRSIYSKQGC